MNGCSSCLGSGCSRRSQDSYVKRTLLADNPAKANLIKTIHEVVAA